MLEVKNLTKRYGEKSAVENLSFTVGAGEIVGFLGPNGAGKSTTMNMLTGYLASTSGEVLIDGVNVLEQPLAAKRLIGYLPERPPLYQEMTVEQYLRFVFRLKGIRENARQHIAQVCELVHIGDVRGRIIRNLSKGYQQRIGIAGALLGYPPLLILDEPTVGLDPKQIMEMRDLILSLGKTQTILLSSHILSEIQAVCGRILVINNGALVADATAAALAQGGNCGGALTVSLAAPQDTARELLLRLPDVVSVSPGTQTEPGVFSFSLTQKQRCDVRAALFALVRENNIPIMSLQPAAARLEDVFLSLTAADAQATATQKEKIS